MIRSEYWPGWRLRKIDLKSTGGDKQRAHNRAKDELNHQQKVLTILQKLEPFLVVGEQSVAVSDERINSILSAIYEDCMGFEIVLRHNFLVNTGIEPVTLGL